MNWWLPHLCRTPITYRNSFNGNSFDSPPVVQHHPLEFVPTLLTTTFLTTDHPPNHMSTCTRRPLIGSLTNPHTAAWDCPLTVIKMPSGKHKQTNTPPRPHSHSLTHFPLSPSFLPSFLPFFLPSLPPSLPPSLSLSLYLSLSLTLSLTHSLSLSPSLSLSLSPPPTHTHSFSLSHSLTQISYSCSHMYTMPQFIIGS